MFKRLTTALEALERRNRHRGEHDQLLGLGEHILRDIGVTRDEVRRARSHRYYL